MPDSTHCKAIYKLELQLLKKPLKLLALKSSNVSMNDLQFITFIVSQGQAKYEIPNF